MKNRPTIHHYFPPAAALASMGLSPTTPPRFTITGMAYNHTQHGRWHYILFALTLATLAGAWLSRHDPGAVVILVAIIDLPPYHYGFVFRRR